MQTPDFNGEVSATMSVARCFLKCTGEFPNPEWMPCELAMYVKEVLILQKATALHAGQLICRN